MKGNYNSRFEHVVYVHAQVEVGNSRMQMRQERKMHVRVFEGKERKKTRQVEVA